MISIKTIEIIRRPIFELRWCLTFIGLEDFYRDLKIFQGLEDFYRT